MESKRFICGPLCLQERFCWLGFQLRLFLELECGKNKCCVVVFPLLRQVVPNEVLLEILGKFGNPCEFWEFVLTFSEVSTKVKLAMRSLMVVWLYSALRARAIFVAIAIKQQRVRKGHMTTFVNVMPTWPAMVATMPRQNRSGKHRDVFEWNSWRGFSRIRKFKLEVYQYIT